HRTSALVERHDQENFRVRLNPSVRWSGTPPWAIWRKVVPALLLNVRANTCAPTRVSNAKAYSAVPTANPPARGAPSSTKNALLLSRRRPPRPMKPVLAVVALPVPVLCTHIGVA